jgi:endonuclease/exonuclease/phosphatase (EEP) superfamily protein YafD
MKYILHLLAVVAAFALLFAAYGGRIDPMVWALPSLVTLALPAVAVVVLALLALLVLCRQWRSAVILVGALFLAWPTLRLISPLNLYSDKADPDKSQLKVLTMNVTEFNWYNDSTLPSKNMRYILDEDADIVLIQEGLVYFSYEQQPRLASMLDELYKKYPYRKKHFFDVGILSKYPFTDVKSPALDRDTMNYFIKAWDVQTPAGELRVVNMHLSSLKLTANESNVIESMNVASGRKRRIQSVATKLESGFQTHARQARALRAMLDEDSGDVLVVGDMNDTPGSYAYRTICGEDLRDAWAETGFGPIYTYHEHYMYVKIDHILYRGDIKPLWCRRVKAGESDHYPVVALFEW